VAHADDEDLGGPIDRFGPDVAADYDDPDDPRFAPAAVDPVVDLLVGLAAGGALELAIGTGRIALPLARRGVRVHGIDLSEAMLDRLRAKPDAERVALTLGDIATTRVEGTFSVVYLVFNTIENLTTQDAQVACFANAAAHLAPGGRFVVEVDVPDLQRLPRGEAFRPFAFSDRHIGIDEYDTVEQGLVSHHLVARDGVYERRSIPFRYVWPAELDLMARLAGMRREAWYGGWRREPFTRDSTTLVGVWAKR
jgi:SAM-dependent methyltransferase